MVSTERPPSSVALLPEASRETRYAPSGQAVVEVLWPGPALFLGRLHLAPGAQVPPHVDPSDEWLWVVEGSGELTVGGEQRPVEVGQLVFLPMGVEASFQNGPAPFVAWQIFLPVAAAEKYQAWEPGPRLAHRVGPFEVRCDQQACTLAHDGQPVGEEIPSFGRAEDLLLPLEPVALDQALPAWLLVTHGGDGCPLLYRGLCLNQGKAMLSEAFGNCEAPRRWEREAEAVQLAFAASEVVPSREAVSYRLDLQTCALGPAAGPAPLPDPARGEAR